MIEFLNILDKNLLLEINSYNCPIVDLIMYLFSDKFFLIPLYAFLIFIIIRKYKKESILIFIMIALLITLTDQISSNLIKNSVQRLRPSHEPSLEGLLHFVNDYKGGDYGFVSSHAANTFGLAVFITLLLKSKIKWIGYVMFTYAFIVSYSRIYLGVHYPSDVIVAAFIGILMGWLIFKFYFVFLKIKFYKFNSKKYV